MYKMAVPGDSFINTPQWWQNFVSCTKLEKPDRALASEYVKQVLLEKYNARVNFNFSKRENDYIIFACEEDATAFILRWS